MKQLLAILALVLPLQLLAGDWQSYSADDYGYSMLVPAGTRMETREFGGGWGGLRGDSQGVKVVGVAKLGAPESAAEIERFGVEVTGIPWANWEIIDEGSGHGWNWYKTVTARNGNRLFFGGYGVGSRGSYLLLLETTPADFKAYRSDYDTWYESIRLH